ncbi:MAG: hypothetical protein K2F79_07580, partial [Muribaculaceae bacterium]|nr:hypothetical protein [Muribaculaceae bacterium]
MTDQQFETKAKAIAGALSFPAEAIGALRSLTSELGQADLLARVNEIDQRHFYMMRTIASGYDVPDFDQEIARTRRAITDILTEADRRRRIETDASAYYAQP